MKKGFLIKFNIDVKGTCFCVASPFLFAHTQHIKLQDYYLLMNISCRYVA